jgi:hypothetical protein
MEDAKLQALHDTLSQIRGKKGLGTNTHYSWQRGAGATQTDRHPAAAHLPDNALYAHFLPEGVYDPNTMRNNFGDGRIVKRDFSDAIMDDDDDDVNDNDRKNKTQKLKLDKTEKERQKEIRKAEKKAAKKAEKLKAKIEEKKRQRKLEKKLKKEQASVATPNNTEIRNNASSEVTSEESDHPVKGNSKKKKIDIPDIENKSDHQTEEGAKKRKKSKGKG